MDTSKDYYKILQIDPSAEPEVIDAAYRRLMLKYHPDINKSTSASEKAKLINEAYDALKDPQKRRDYDGARKYSNSYRTNASGSARNYEAESERQRRQQAEREAYEAKKQAEQERKNAEYERAKRKQAEDAVKQAEKRTNTLNNSAEFVNWVNGFLTKNRSILILTIIFIIILLMTKPVERITTLAFQAFRIATETVSVPEVSTMVNTATSDTTSKGIVQIIEPTSKATDVQMSQESKFEEEILFYDDFEDIGFTETNWESDETKWEISNGSLNFIHNGRAFAGDTNWTDYEYSVNVNAVKTIDKSIFFRYTDNWHNYYVFVRSSPINDVVLVKTTPSAPNHILTSSSFMNSASTWYSIKVIVEGNQIQVLVNDVLKIDYIDSDSPLLTGKIGILANLSSAEGASVFFDNVLVTDI